MSSYMKAALTEFLRNNTDVFAWKPSNTLGIPYEIAEHRLNILADAKPI